MRVRVPPLILAATGLCAVAAAEAQAQTPPPANPLDAVPDSIVGGKLIGAIGCSGGTGSQDEMVCKTGAASVK